MSGNIRVICRLRPENQVERDSGGYRCVQFQGNTLEIQLQDTQQRSGESHKFTFDYIFDATSKQTEVYNVAASPVVQGVLDGYNGTIFAYGQTGSGKTFTMEGPDINDQEMKGIIPRMMDGLFEGLINAPEALEFSLKVSFMEIYLERIHDLIDPSRTNLVIKEDRGRGIYVKDSSEVYVTSPKEMMRVMTLGSSNRSIAATRMNQRSSRSHSIFIVSVEQNNTETGSRKSGRLYFVDLAGSESVGKTHVKGKQLEEAKMINKSLSALGNVINALTEKNAGFVPYRDSKLTRMLQESIGGNSQTTLVIACSMSSYNDKETLSTLRFGQRAKKIQNRVIQNQERSAKELLKELDQVQKELSKQVEIINSIQTHIHGSYSDHPSLVQEITGIIEHSFEVRSSHSPHESTTETEHSMTLLKQHTELVSLFEELQQVQLEKKELEDELGYRNKEIVEYLDQIAEMQKGMTEMTESHRQEMEYMQNTLDKTMQENERRKNIDFKMLKRACERLRSDIMLVRNEIPTEDSCWGYIILQALNEALPVITEAEFSLFGENTGSFNDDEGSLKLKKGLNKSVPDLRYLKEDDDSTKAAEEDSEKIRELELLIDEQRHIIDKLNEKNNDINSHNKELSAQLHHTTANLNSKDSELAEIKDGYAKLEEDYNILLQQLEQKVQNVEEEREVMNAELSFRNAQIEELQALLEQEKDQLNTLISTDNTKKILFESDNRLKELCKERQKLFEELVGLRKQLDQRDEQLHNALQRNNRLERQLAVRNPKAPSTNRISQAVPSSVKPVVENQPLFFNKKVIKPIRGGGGDAWSFQKNNKGVIEEREETKQNTRAPPRPTPKMGAKPGGLGAMFKGFVNNFLG